MDYKIEIKNLKHYAQMKTIEDIKLFEETVYRLADTKDPKILEELIDIFDDNCEFPEVMYSLVHAIETYPSDLYVKTILNKLEDFHHNLEWLKTMIYGIINSQECLEILKENLSLANKKQLLKILNIIDKESKYHHLIIKSVKQKLKELQ